MPTKISRDIPSLGTEKFLQSKTVVNKFVDQVGNSTKINRGKDDSIGFNAFEGLRSGNKILNVTIENLSAADSTTHGKTIAKEIAILTRKYILQTTSIATEDQTHL